MKFFKKISYPIVAASVFSMVFTGCGGGEEPAVSDAVVEENLVAVETNAIDYSNIKRELVYGGQVQPNETVNVTSKLSGQVQKINYDVGDFVNKGDVMFTIDQKSIQDQIRQLEAQLNVSDASLKSAQVSLQQVDGGQSQSQIVSMKSAVENAEASLENAEIQMNNSKIQMDDAKIQMDDAKIQMENAALAVQTSKASLDDVEKTYNNMKVLYNAGTISKNDFDAAELRYTQSKSSYDQAVNANNQAINAYDKSVNAYNKSINAYEQSKVSYGQGETAYNQAKESYDIYVDKITSENRTSAQTGVATAAASKHSVETQLQILRESLNDTSVTAPISGTISAKNIDETNMVSAQSAPFTIVDTSIVTVEVNVSEKIINAISTGQNVDVYINTISDEAFTGRIKTINPSADNTKTYPVKIEIINNDGDIKPGMFAEIHFIESQKNDTFVVPRNTVLENETEKYVYVIEDGKAVKKAVETGIDNGESIEIVSGINIGEEVVIKGQSLVTEGKSVNVVSGPSANNQNDNSDDNSDDENSKNEDDDNNDDKKSQNETAKEE